MDECTTVHVQSIDNFEQLQNALRGIQREIVQLECGQLRGRMAHLTVGGLPINVGTFSLGLRSTGICSHDRITIGMLTECTSRVTRWSREIRPGDAVVTSPGDENERRYFGGASYAATSLTPTEIRSFFAGEPRLREMEFWQSNHFPAAPQSLDDLIPRLNKLIARLLDKSTNLTADAAEFWKRSIIDIMTAAVLANTPSDDDRPLPSALKVVKNVDAYLDWKQTAPIHISQICGRLNVSRRTLHRAFHDSLGIGPVTYLQRRRLCAVHSALRCSDPATTTIANIAMQHGFLNLGRFSGYYRSLFNEYPSDTFGNSRRVRR